MANSKPIYTNEQLRQFFDHIELHKLDVAAAAKGATSSDPSTQLKLLTKILHGTLAHVPFENLDLHYAPLRGISLNTTHLFEKVVTRNVGRGGYCMQNNALFATVLRSLGFNVYSAGAKVVKAFMVEPDPNSSANVVHDVQEVEYRGYGHQVSIVTLSDNSRYFVDVGFGSSGPAWPVPLEDGFTRINTGNDSNIGTSMRLIRGFPNEASPGARRPETAFWVYAVKFATADEPSKQWIPCYCFTDYEFYPSDYEVMSAYVSSRSAMFLNSVFCQKFVIEQQDDGQTIVVGDISLNNDSIKERRYGVNKVLAEVKSESDRVEGLEKCMNVRLSQAEREGIRWSPAMIN